MIATAAALPAKTVTGLLGIEVTPPLVVAVPPVRVAVPPAVGVPLSASVTAVPSTTGLPPASVTVAVSVKVVSAETVVGVVAGLVAGCCVIETEDAGPGAMANGLLVADVRDTPLAVNE